MKIILHGILAERFGAEHTISTDVPADAIEGLSRQLPGWPQDLRIDVVGFGTEALLRAPTSATEIHMMPAMFGGGGKWGSIIIGVAMIGLAFIPGLQVIGIAGMKLALGHILLTMGVGLLLSGVSQLFMKAPTTSKSNDPDPSKYFGLNKTTTEVGTLRTLAWGRIRLSGHWLSLQSDSTNLVLASFPTNPT